MRRSKAKQLKQIPNFKNEDEERRFWAKADSTEYVDWSTAKNISFPNLKPSTKTVSLRLTESLLCEIKRIANERDVPYQSLMKVLLTEKVANIARGR